MIEACVNLKNRGYTLALDDFVFDKRYIRLIEIADIIKVDFTITKGNDRKNIIELSEINNKIKFLAEKVETMEEFNVAIYFGYDYFQGYYFSKPVIVSAKGIPTGKHILFQVLRELHKEEINFADLEVLILKDVALSYKLLKLINSAFFGMKSKIQSVKQAMAFLGEVEIIKWLYVVILNDFRGERTSAVIDLALLRARFAEILTSVSDIKDKTYYAYMTGMFSLMEAILNVSIVNIVEEMYLPRQVQEALVKKNNGIAMIIELVKAYEKGDWDNVGCLAYKMNIDSRLISGIYFDSLEWLKSVQ